ncbi:MAG TPA: 6,7-dimethyl-8-ribityllumazine synthase [Acidimicrobiales bacterium]|nr:6,7-dimethyl-8-ribityllumazine synthase [Acidimicrobiales bacterium]
MSSTDEAALPEGAVAELARAVGVQLVGETDGTGLQIAIAAARFNGGITRRLIDGALDGLAACSVERANVSLAWVPGAFELPLLAQYFANSGTVHAVVCLGAVIRGETGHYDFVAGQCAAGIQRVQLDTGLPVVFGVLTTENLEQALERSRPDETNRGRDAAFTAVEMVRLLAADSPLARLGG